MQALSFSTAVAGAKVQAKAPRAVAAKAGLVVKAGAYDAELIATAVRGPRPSPRAAAAAAGARAPGR